MRCAIINVHIRVKWLVYVTTNMTVYDTSINCKPIWWRHQMETFSALLALCAGNSSVTGEFPSQRPVTRGFHVFFDLRLNKRLSKQSRRRWFETPSRSLWRHCNECPSFGLSQECKVMTSGCVWMCPWLPRKPVFQWGIPGEIWVTKQSIDPMISIIAREFITDRIRYT